MKCKVSNALAEGSRRAGDLAPTQQSCDLHKRRVSTSSSGFCCDTIAIRCRDLSPLEAIHVGLLWAAKQGLGCPDLPWSWCNDQPQPG